MSDLEILRVLISLKERSDTRFDLQAVAEMLFARRRLAITEVEGPGRDDCIGILSRRGFSFLPGTGGMWTLLSPGVGAPSGSPREDGLLFGYPPCCVDFFVSRREERMTFPLLSLRAAGSQGPFPPELNNIHCLDTVPYSKAGVDAHRLGRLIRRRKRTFVRHQLCRYDCPASLEGVRSVLAAIEEADPVFYSRHVATDLAALRADILFRDVFNYVDLPGSEFDPRTGRLHYREFDVIGLGPGIRRLLGSGKPLDLSDPHLRGLTRIAFGRAGADRTPA
ncbi:MAG: hypothetical protein WC728_01120 [Elusimicrobiota bacterium]